MKKVLPLLLAVVMVISLAACNTGDAQNNNDSTTVGNDGGTQNNNDSTTVGNDGDHIDLPESALALLETAWATHNEEEKLYFMGGDLDSNVSGAPGAAADMDFINYTLLLPSQLNDKIDQAASLMHAMNANNLTCAAYHLTDGTDIDSFVTAVQENIQNNPWMCGFPEELVIYTLGGEYVVVMFGKADITAPFRQELVTAFPELKLAVEEAIA